MAMTVEKTKNISTCGPPTRSSDRLAPKPMVVKNAIISGGCERRVERDERHVRPLREQ